MLSERRLKKWRIEAIKASGANIIPLYKDTAEGLATRYMKCQQQILYMTQELLDQRLIQKDLDSREK